MSMAMPELPDIDAFDDPRPRYRLCRIAFALASVALGLQAAQLALQLYVEFTSDRRLAQVLMHPQWNLWVGTALSWGAAIASYLLIGRFADARWNRRAGLLALMNSVDLLIWASRHASLLSLGDTLAVLRNPWLGQGLYVLQWFELLLFAELAAELGTHLGRAEARDTLQPARATALIGLAIWSLYFCSFSAAYLRGRQVLGNPRWLMELLMLRLGFHAMLVVSAFLVTALCLTASRECRRLLDEFRVHDREGPWPTARPEREPPGRSGA